MGRVRPVWRAPKPQRAGAVASLREAHGAEARVVLLPPGSLPHTSSGKLSRTLARRRYLAGRFTAGASALAALPE